LGSRWSVSPTGDFVLLMKRAIFLNMKYTVKMSEPSSRLCMILQGARDSTYCWYPIHKLELSFDDCTYHGGFLVVTNNERRRRAQS
jgi:hypothetical protein